jgi:hypothetical protein
MIPSSYGKTSYLQVARGPSIIVVGPDRVGKTTLVGHMSEILGVPSFKCPAEKKIFREGGRSSLAFDYTLTNFLGQTGYRFISDRGYPCEWVYSRVFKRETDMDLLGRIDVMHAAMGTRILYVHSSEPPREEDDLVPADRYWDVVRGYDDFMHATDTKAYAVDAKEMLRAFQLGGDISGCSPRSALT